MDRQTEKENLITQLRENLEAVSRNSQLTKLNEDATNIQEQLSKILFPVGGMYKKDIRKIAENIELPTAKRPDSMGICFVGEVDIKEFLK